VRTERDASGSGFLSTMADASAERARVARRELSLVALQDRVRKRVATGDRPPRLRRHPAGFDVVAEVKFASPSAGALSDSPSPEAAAERAASYAEAGACAISVLTEPTRFRGSLDHLRAAARTASAPVMRKDFLVDPYQVWEAREAGAGGVLVIVSLVDDDILARMVEAARETGLFVLLEAFDEADLERLAAFLATPAAGDVTLLAGVNGRDLRTLEVDPERHLRLAPLLPASIPAVAESGLSEPDDARRAARAGYRLALVGTALMRASDPAERLRELVSAGREASEERR